MLSKKPTNSANEDRLSELIRLKKLERPDGKFWDRFDRELRNRQLTALVQTSSWRERIGSMTLVALRKSAVFAAMASVLALGLLTAYKTGLYPGANLEPHSQTVETPVTQNENPAVEAPIFVVVNTATSTSSVVADASPVHLGSPTYEMHRITKQSVPASYQIMAEPKQFRASQSTADQQSLGAKIIRTGTHF